MLNRLKLFKKNIIIVLGQDNLLTYAKNYKLSESASRERKI